MEQNGSDDDDKPQDRAYILGIERGVEQPG